MASVPYRGRSGSPLTPVHAGRKETGEGLAGRGKWSPEGERGRGEEGRSVGRVGGDGGVEGTARTTAIIFSVCHGGGGKKKRERGRKEVEDLARAFRLKYPLPLEIHVSRAAGLDRARYGGL